MRLQSRHRGGNFVPYTSVLTGVSLLPHEWPCVTVSFPSLRAVSTHTVSPAPSVTNIIRITLDLYY